MAWQAVAAVRLLALTGCRRDEVLRLRWEHVDLAAGRLLLPDSETGGGPFGPWRLLRACCWSS